MTCEEFEELSGAYALDAVTPAEREAAGEHLATCPRCTALLQELREVVTLLPLAAPQVEPSPALKERIFAAIREDSQRTAHPTPQTQQPVPLARARRQRRNRGMLIAAAALILALLGGLTAWNVSLQTQLVALRSQTTSSNVVSYPVQGSAGTASGQLIYFAQQNITVLLIHGLPQLQGAHVYQGWLIHTKGGSLSSGIKDTTSIGLLNVQDGKATVSFEGNVSGYDATAVSLEKGPFATPHAPQGSVVAIGALKHTASIKNNSGTFSFVLLPFKSND